MKQTCLLFLVLLASQGVHSQKVIRKAVINPGISFFEIDTENCYRVEITTSDTQELRVQAVLDGEYGKDLLVRVEEEGSTARVSAGFQPNFVAPNDKLSAHKLVSISLVISLPAQHRVLVSGTGSDVSISGSYSDLQVILNDGRCLLNAVGEKITVHTRSGDIILRHARGSVTARSKYGKVFREPFPEGGSFYTLETVTGDIELRKSD